ncbi:MAG: histidine ammonia-lyase [Clostridia bacterium]
MKKSVTIKNGLTIDDVVSVARFGAKVRLSPDCNERIIKARSLVDLIVKNGKAVYGINTGFGKFSDVAISPEDTATLQLNLIKSHACGVGDIMPMEIVRALMLLRLNALSMGFSGVSTETLNTLLNMLNKNVIPYIPCKGSLGASGDLAPLAHMALSMVGEGNSYYHGKLLDGKEALIKANIKPAVLSAKEGLALINGTQAMNAYSVLNVYDAKKLFDNADMTLALTMEALEGIISAYDERIHTIRRQNGQIEVAAHIRSLLTGSANITKQGEKRVQDAYTLRCAPQVHGACKDAIAYVEDIVSKEINAVTDNPLLFTETFEAISGGNFHGEYLSMAMDFLGIALSEIANISERRIERMVNPQLSNGLAPFLVKEGGLNSGFMIPQYVAAALVSENKVLAHPAVVDSITSSANQEDHVSMGMTAARKAREILTNTQRVIGIELLTACQAIDIRESAEKLAPSTKEMYLKVRETVPFVEKDTYLKPLIDQCYEIIRN